MQSPREQDKSRNTERHVADSSQAFLTFAARWGALQFPRSPAAIPEIPGPYTPGGGKTIGTILRPRYRLAASESFVAFAVSARHTRDGCLRIAFLAWLLDNRGQVPSPIDTSS